MFDLFGGEETALADEDGASILSSIKNTECLKLAISCLFQAKPTQESLSVTTQSFKLFDACLDAILEESNCLISTLPAPLLN